MRKDPWMQWEEGVFPYDALAKAGVTPDSSMKAVREDALHLMAQGAFSRSQRAAWDELRQVERRLWVDIWLHLFSDEDLAGTLQTLLAQGEPQVALPETAHLLQPDLTELERMEGDFGTIDESALDIRSPPLRVAANLEFDS